MLSQSLESVAGVGCNLHIIHADPIILPVGTAENNREWIRRGDGLESRGGRVPVPRCPPRNIAACRHATGGRLVGVSDREGAVAGCGVVELVVYEDRVVVAGACVHGLLESLAAGAVGIGSRVEDGGEGIFPAAVVRAAGTGKAVGRRSNEADNSPSVSPRCWGC